jgi:hypothetical protein
MQPASSDEDFFIVSNPFASSTGGGVRGLLFGSRLQHGRGAEELSPIRK